MGGQDGAGGRKQGEEKGDTLMGKRRGERLFPVQTSVTAGL